MPNSLQTLLPSAAAQDESPRVLLVDDDALLLRALTRVLTRAGCGVLTAHTGDDAARLLDKHTFDTVLCDVYLGNCDGLQLLRLAHERDPDLHVLLMTGAADVSSAADTVALHAYKCLLKPVDSEDLTASVAGAVAATRRARTDREMVETLAVGTAVRIARVPQS
jgi:DNA-binding NtrC family response regulator